MVTTTPRRIVNDTGFHVDSNVDVIQTKKAPKINIIQQRRIRRIKLPPTNPWNKLVTSDGSNISVIASINPRNVAIMAIDTVGNPNPIKPFMAPADRKTTATRTRVSIFI